MELVTLITIIGAGSILFLLSTLYQIVVYKHKMSDTAYHHLISHGYLVLFFSISINVFYFYGYVTPMAFTFAYVVQHVFKENLRLIHTNKWTEDVKDD